jgi:hypothetical protein
MAQQPVVGQNLLIFGTSPSHSETTHSVGLLRTSDRPDARDLYLTTHNSHNRQTFMTPAGFEPTMSASETAADWRLRPRGHWDRLQQGWPIFLRAYAQIVYKFGRNPFSCLWEFWKQNKVLDPSIITINYCIIITNTTVSLQAYSDPEGSWKLRFPDFKTTPQDGGKVITLTHRPPLPPGNFPGTHFC